MKQGQAIATMYIEAPAESIWGYFASRSGMNAYLTDEVSCKREVIQAGDAVQIVIGDMINEAICVESEYPHRFVLKDRYRSLLADNSYLEYELTTTFLLASEEAMTKVTVIAEGYNEKDQFMQWLRECGELGWRQSLFNLKNVLELGLDLRYHIFGYPRLGVCNYTASRDQIQQQGLHPDEIGGNILMEVFPNSPAELAGLFKNDLVIALGGYPVPTYHEFVKALALSYRHNRSIVIDYYRNGMLTRTTATLSTAPLLTGLVQPTEESVARIKSGKKELPGPTDELTK